MNEVVQKVLETKSLEDLEVSGPKKTKDTLKYTEAKVEEAIGLIKKIEQLGGYGKVAKATGLKRKQLRIIKKAMDARKAELKQAEAPEDEGI